MRETQVNTSRQYSLKWLLSWPLHRIGKSSQEHGSQLNSLIIEAGNPGNHRPKFQAKFHVPEEEADGPLQRLVQRRRQGFGHHAL